MEMPRFDQVGQERNSVDCGWFCGYVLSLNKRHAGRVDQMTMTQESVYAARERALNREGSRSRMGPSTEWLAPGMAPTYLRQLGVSNYTSAFITLNQTNFERVIGRFFQNPNCWGVMLPLIGVGSGPNIPGHWIAILGPATGGNWVYYDPSGTGTTLYQPPFAANDTPANIAGYARNAIVSIVRPVQ